MSDDRIRRDIKMRMARVFRRASNARLVEEVEICGGRSRADMVVISHRLIGIEIKGPADSLQRLRSQAHYYSQCFDHVVIVADDSLAEKASSVIPEWWGLVASRSGEHVNAYRLLRRPQRNPSVELAVVLTLLWRHELETLLDTLLGTSSGNSPKRKLRETLMSYVTPSRLKEASLEILRNREQWRSVCLGS